VFAGTVNRVAGRLELLRELCGKKAVNGIYAGPWGGFGVLIEVIEVGGVGVEVEIVVVVEGEVTVVIEGEVTVIPEVFGAGVTGVLTGGLLSDFPEESFVLIELSGEILSMERVVGVFEDFMVEGVDLFGLLFDLDLDVLGIDEQDLVEEANQEFIKIFLYWNQLGLILILKQVVLQIYRSFFKFHLFLLSEVTIAFGDDLVVEVEDAVFVQFIVFF
jgi:hypothetical protein